MSTWVLLRGLARGSGHWDRFAHTLQHRIEGASVVALDLPGNGTRHAQRSPASIAAMTEDCWRQIAALGVRPPYRLVAVSLGAMVAVDWAARAPHGLAGCVLVNASLRSLSPWYRRLRPASYSSLLRAAFAADAIDKERHILRVTSRNERAACRVLDTWAALQRSQPVSRSNTLRQLWAAARFAPPQQAPALPLLVLSGSGDDLVDPSCSKAIATLWHGDHATHPWAGHDLTLDDGEWVADRVAEWSGG